MLALAEVAEIEARSPFRLPSPSLTLIPHRQHLTAAAVAGRIPKTAYIEKSSPWENCYVESFNGKLRDELLNVEVFNSLGEAQFLIEGWQRHYNSIRPHSGLGYRPPAPEVTLRTPTAWPAAQPRPAPPTMLLPVPRPTLN